MSVYIFLEYQLIGSDRWEVIELLPEDYFDLDPDEKIEWDCVSEYNHAVEYLDIEREKLSHTKLKIVDDEANVTEVIKTTFWNDGKNQIDERIIDRDTGGSEWLMVMTIKLQDNPNIWEILRLQRKDDVPILEFHSFITDNEDGSQSERIIYPIC
ncbi:MULTISPECIES: hypothetical protein [Kamptonema]|uniref:hypothetical protein n=1 Tax=Kamptonema TaxID=1501433 RepID=UPI0001DAD143|nr:MULTISPECIES: hypothetical protein [Kamptonema]CBN54039.1 conserved hypothetical protein [Kamptonema sp. PCC 6506]